MLLHQHLLAELLMRILTLSTSTGIISGIPGQFTANSTPTKTIAIANAVSGGPAGSFAMNIVANSAFFTYNADGGKGVTLPNIYYFVQGQEAECSKRNLSWLYQMQV